ncbi:NnrU family protein [Altererythrobacter sp. MTPC7]|uniref:NnrU family protein n=1 Tax=Altererythrobacter sp. MTPC7 TaxID=3056567 RepID=UPI0036F31678
MDPALLSLAAANTAFVGTHFALSHPLRAPLVRALGAGGFQMVYNLVAAATLAWIYFAFVAVGGGAPLWGGFGDGVWIVASVLSLAGSVLFTGSIVRPNPALPTPMAAKQAKGTPQGALRVTRHPMMWGFALIALAHLIAAPTPRTLITMGAMLFLALVGAKLQDGKKRGQMGEAWEHWEAQTTYMPRLSHVGAIGAVPWIGGALLWLALTYAHIPTGGMAAGLWRWLT